MTGAASPGHQHVAAPSLPRDLNRGRVDSSLPLPSALERDGHDGVDEGSLQCDRSYQECLRGAVDPQNRSEHEAGPRGEALGL